MKESYLLVLMEMRLLIGFLGERAQFGWWPTAFYGASSRPFLEPVFSKTTRLAQYYGVLEVARRQHDEHLSVGCYHLFRLPEEVEQDLHLIMQSTVGEELTVKYLQTKAVALDELKRIALSMVQIGEGPLAVGIIKDLASSNTLQAIGSAYLSAFSRKTKIFPYILA